LLSCFISVVRTERRAAGVAGPDRAFGPDAPQRPESRREALRRGWNGGTRRERQPRRSTRGERTRPGGRASEQDQGAEYRRHTGGRARYTFFAQKATQYQCDRRNGVPVMRGDAMPPRGALAKDAEFIRRQAPSVTFFLARQCVWCASHSISVSRSYARGRGLGRVRRTQLAGLGATQVNGDTTFLPGTRLGK